MRAVAGRVTQHGIKFEEMLREREAKNEKFSFLRDVDVSIGRTEAASFIERG